MACHLFKELISLGLQARFAALMLLLIATKTKDKEIA